MNKLLTLLCCICIQQSLSAQVLGTGPAAIGTGTAHAETSLLTNWNGRDYFINRKINSPLGGQTEDQQGINYVLLHALYNGINLADHHVMGRITGMRGHEGAYNRRITVEVNTASAYQQNMGSIVSYNDPSRLVILTYNNVRYVALEISNWASMVYWSFTGYASPNAKLEIVFDQQVSDVQDFTALSPVSVQGALGIGHSAPEEKLDVYEGAIRIQRTTQPFTGNFNNIKALWLNGVNPEGEVALGYSSYGGGAAAIGFSRGGGFNTSIRFYTNPLSNPGTHNMIQRMIISDEGNVGIGTNNPQAYKLAVEGTIGARKVKVSAESWADFVFDASYRLPSLQEVEKHILQYKHLPGIPPEAVVKAEGVDLGDMNVKLLQKVEELTLYLIEMKKENSAMKERLEKLEGKL